MCAMYVCAKTVPLRAPNRAPSGPARKLTISVYRYHVFDERLRCMATSQYTVSLGCEPACSVTRENAFVSSTVELYV